MTSDRVFYIDDKPYPLEHSPVKVSTLLHFAGTSGEDALLVSSDGFEYGEPDELIDIAPSTHFTTKKGIMTANRSRNQSVTRLTGNRAPRSRIPFR